MKPPSAMLNMNLLVRKSSLATSTFALAPVGRVCGHQCTAMKAMVAAPTISLLLALLFFRLHLLFLLFNICCQLDTSEMNENCSESLISLSINQPLLRSHRHSSSPLLPACCCLHQCCCCCCCWPHRCCCCCWPHQCCCCCCWLHQAWWQCYCLLLLQASVASEK